ncbi:MarR family transcriptional regulator [Microbacterium protaetiae]|uniref:MarR family transcriptional regulator n=1 Tax=Microbacterium protaetiae TaxID=2509458 RepID=A0A4P6EBK7_9MICO|nr:MarR family transcriptional regulator [Microbacterium protaetiae]QAY58966.1 MarR family transcriptional regulator [Microbacterium protaetiae]
MSDVTDIDETAAALRVVASRLYRRLRAEAGNAEYSAAQVAVIRRLLDEGPATTSELARAEGMRPQSMSATVASLVDAGILTRQPDPNDGRAVQVSLSDDGERALRQGRSAKQEWLVRTLSERFTADELHTLTAAVALVERMLQPDPKDAL